MHDRPGTGLAERVAAPIPSIPPNVGCSRRAMTFVRAAGVVPNVLAHQFTLNGSEYVVFALHQLCRPMVQKWSLVGDSRAVDDIYVVRFPTILPKLRAIM